MDGVSGTDYDMPRKPGTRIESPDTQEENAAFGT